ncbi:MAG: extracellular solute-binding protein [Devosia nanyangense]|uniref:Extracellular solute-binding protein n=1 Tax=Devosia nanyangense TaxID=1228055 RepID=A0A933L349_9HYPH|nr:extracellular solute-binding protein [Devosia nanyangense]
MLKRHLLAAAAATTLLVSALPAQAVSIAYNANFEALIAPGIAAYEAATGQKVDAIKLPGGDDYSTRIQTDLSAGTAADVIMLDSYIVAEYAGSNYLAPLDDLLKDWDQFKDFMKGPLDVVSYNGKVYALPNGTDVRMLYYNKADFTKAGLPIPWAPKTWADVIDAGKALNKVGVANAFLLEAGTKWGEGTTMQGFYMTLLGADTPDGDRNRLRDRASGKWIGDSPAIRNTLKFYQDVYVNDKISGTAINYAADVFNDTNNAFLAGDIGIYATGNWANDCLWGCGNANQPSQEEKDKLVGFSPWPGSGLPGAKATTNISGGWTVALTAKAATNPDAIKLLEAIYDAKNLGKWTVDTKTLTVRQDIADSDAYKSNPFLAQITAMVADTTGRDTVPGYAKVSALVQDMTAGILDGKSIDDVVKTYHDALVDEFGADAVVTLQ